jgi:hypothetical protein
MSQLKSYNTNTGTWDPVIVGAGGPTGPTGTAGPTGPANSGGTSATQIAIGTIAQRPSSPTNGMMRINSDLGILEVYYNSVWNAVGGVGIGQSSASPAYSAAQLRFYGITTSGVYWFSTPSNPTPFQCYVAFNYIDGGDWYLVLKVHNQGDMPSGSPYWKNNSTWNSSDFNLTSGNWAKYASWNAFSFNRVMLEMWQGGTQHIPPIMVWNTAKTSMYNVLSGITPNTVGSAVLCDSTDPAMGNSQYYYSMPMKSGTNFTNNGGAESIMQGYGLGSFFAGNSSNSTTAEGLPSLGLTGAWIGCPLDDGGHTFNAASNSGADSAFGFGAGGGNPAKTTSSGYCTWTISTSTNCLPGYVWIR